MTYLKPRTLIIGLSILAGSTLFSSAQAAIMLSQYIHGSQNKKGLEIYNPDATAVNLSEYEIRQYMNGNTTPNLIVKLTGSLPSRGTYIVGRSELKTELGDLVKQQANLAFNGDDALVLYHNQTAIDRFGRVGEQPANGWDNISKDNSFKRTVLSNSMSSIDPTSVFDLKSAWEKWSDRDAFSTYLNIDTVVQPPVTELSCSTSSTAIADLSSATQKQDYVVRGVMTADYRYANGFSGFYIQTVDSQAKANVSNAIFVYIPASSNIQGGKVGDEVILRGSLNTYQNQLQIEELKTAVTVCDSNVGSKVSATPLQLPFDSLTSAVGHAPKRYQGMLVQIPQVLTVSENYTYGRYGDLSLSLGRLFIPTNLFPAKSAEAKALAKQNLHSKIILDDGYGSQNRTPWLPQNFSASNTLRSGYQIKNVAGILEYRFGAWRIQPILNQATPELLPNANIRTPIAAKDSNRVRVAAFNVLNYDNAVLNGETSERGAESVSEFNRQHQKILSAMKSIDADVYGLMEIANNGYDQKSAIAYLARALGSDWKYVIPPNANKLGSDVIAVGILYNSKRVKTLSDAVVYDDLTQKNRVTMAQSFSPLNGGKTFTVIPNHLKSKGSCPTDTTSPDADQGDGQGCWNATRLDAANNLVKWIGTNPTKANNPHFLLIGDMNSYAKEDPILALEKANFKVLLNDEKIGQGKSAYSYVFGVASDPNGFGGAGNLDHAIADTELYPMVKQAFTWHINADEPSVIDYNENFKTEEQKATFYSDDPYRSSDHDPVIVDLALSDSVVVPDSPDSNSSGGSTGIWTLFGLFILMLLGLYRHKRVALRKI